MKKHIYLLLFCWFWSLASYAQTPQKMTYVYDALNRLTEVTYPNGSKITYNYDILGNRNSVAIVGGCALPTAVLTGTQTITAGQTTNILVTLTGVAPWSIVMNGTTYTASASPFSISVSPNTTTTYSLTSVSNSCGAGTVSGSAVVSVNPACVLPVATLTGTQTITAGQTANLSVAITGVRPWSIVMNGIAYSVNNSLSNLPVSPSITTTYTLTSVSNSCGVGTVSGSAVVTVNACTNMYTLKTGSWNDITVWSCGRVPASIDIITVKASHFITIPAVYTANAKNVVYETGGKIIEAANTSKLCLSCPPIPTNGLVLYLPLDGNANDASGNNNNGVVTGAILGNDRFGVANKAYRFNDGNRISVTNTLSLVLTNSFTFSVWVNMQSNTGRDGNGAVSTTPQQCLFTKNCDNGQIRSSISPQSNGTYILQTYANAGDQLAIPFQLNQWKHIVSTYDGTTLKQFVDGVLVTTKPVVLSLALSNNYNLVIGNMGCYVYYFNGFMDEFRMYNRGLSNSEVLDIYNGEKP